MSIPVTRPAVRGPEERAPRDGHAVRQFRAKAELVVESGGRTRLVHGLREVWAFREVVWAFAERDVRVKYKQAVLGVAWAVLQPLAFLTVFTIIFGRVAGLSDGHATYPAATLSALVPWMFLQTSISFGTQALQADGSLLRKVYFAREAPVLGAVISSCVDFAIGIGLLLVLAPFLGTRFSWTMVLAIPLWLLLLVLASGFSLGLGALTVYYRDFRYALPVGLQIWMFASPVAYPLTAVPARWKTVYILANPAAGILDGFRKVLGGGQPPDLGLLAVSGGATVIVAWAGYALFKRLEAGFADTV